jgi:MFS family permease
MNSLRIARFSVFAFFTITGASVTFWAVHIPYVEDKLQISHAVIGGILLVFGAGSLTAIQIVGHFIDRFGSKAATTFSGVFLGLTMFLPGLANDPFWLGFALYLMGIGVGATDVAMNAQAVEVEKAYKRAIFSTFHAMWSIGGLIGATLGGLALASGLEMQTTMSLAAIATIIISMILGPTLLQNPSIEKPLVESTRKTAKFLALFGSLEQWRELQLLPKEQVVTGQLFITRELLKAHLRKHPSPLWFLQAPWELQDCLSTSWFLKREEFLLFDMVLWFPQLEPSCSYSPLLL